MISIHLDIALNEDRPDPENCSSRNALPDAPGQLDLQLGWRPSVNN